MKSDKRENEEEKINKGMAATTVGVGLIRREKIRISERY